VERLVEIGLSNALMAAALALVAVLVGLLCRRPALVHALWLLVLVKLVTPPLLPFHLRPAVALLEETEQVSRSEPLPGAAADEAAEDEPLPGVEEDAPMEEVAEAAEAVAEGPAALAPADGMAGEKAVGLAWRPEWIKVLAGVWFTGSLAWFWLAIHRAWRFSRALRHARPAPAGLQKRVAALGRRVGLDRCPPVLLLPGRVAPLVWAAGRVRLLLPGGLEEEVGPSGLDTLLLHELAHVRRRDHLVRWLEFLALGLFWWNPVAWYARRELREAEEQCCDAWVVRTLPGTSRTYATALVDALEFLSAARSALPPLASGLGQVADLKRRLTMIMRGTTPAGLGRSSGLAVLGLALLLLPLGPVLGLAQTDNEDPKAKVRFLLSEVKKEAASPDLKQIEADIAAKADELEKLKVKLALLKKKVSAEAEAQKRAAGALKRALVERKIDVGRYVASATRQAGPVIRIEISGLSMKPEELKELVDKLEKSLPGKEKRVIVMVGAGGAVNRVGVVRGIAVSPPVPKVVLPGVPGRPPTPPVPPGDKRIDSVEKKLDQLLRELEAIRKELRGPRRPGAIRLGDRDPQAPAER
jgi:beta-lactamase regulating signal transducer with metallopeptidase domain